MLLDSNVVIWWLLGDGRLGQKARRILSSQDQNLIVSVLTVFEIELKQKAGKLHLKRPITTFLDQFSAQIYSPTAEEMHQLASPKLSHNDPFDLALIGLGSLKNWTVITSDGRLLDEGAQYTKLINSRE